MKVAVGLATILLTGSVWAASPSECAQHIKSDFYIYEMPVAGHYSVDQACYEAQLRKEWRERAEGKEIPPRSGFWTEPYRLNKRLFGIEHDLTTKKTPTE